MWSTIYLLAAAAADPVTVHETLFLDGECGEYASIGAQRYAVADGAQLWLAQTSSEVWLCVTLPEDALGTADVRVESPGLAQPLNLHVSAQLGEWLADDPTTAPRDGNSPLWWNQRGWYANWIHVHGYRTTESGVRPRFEPGTAREIVLRKDRFGTGGWRLRFELRLHPEDERVTVWPQTGALAVDVS